MAKARRYSQRSGIGRLSMSTSSKPSKVRKRQLQCPKHLRSRKLHAHLTDSLATKYGTRSMGVRKGDKVLLMRGDFAGHEDEITEVDLERGFVYVRDVTKEKADGTKSFLPVRASNIEITNLNLDDERRQKILQRRGMP
jgi:large subunit ribosomal protein L24